MKDERTIGDLAREALAVQDACNLCGLAQAFARAGSRLLELEHSTHKVNEHPIVRVWLDKLSQLAGVQAFGDWRITQAFAAVALMAKPDEPTEAKAEPSEPARPSFEVALAAWLEQSQQRVNERHAREFPTSQFEPRQLSIDPGGVKFVRVVATDGPSRSALAFVERATGDIFKPDGWKKPAKGARGNIYRQPEGISTMGQLYR